MLFDGFRRLDPGVLSEHVYVRFEVSRLSSASVVWLNDRWLIQLGLDPMDLATRQGFIDELLSSFAVQSIDQLKADGHCRPADGFLNADRYGGTDGTIHGGSGRCGSKHGYIAKGIGRTPLVSTLADPGHSNGFLSLSEAFKEAIWSEIIEREFPWGAVPVVAIIDADVTFPADGESAPRHAAILIRPTFVRPAHFERSIFFGRGGHPDSEQFKDALRVKTAILGLTARSDLYPGLDEAFVRYAQQIGAGRASRLWLGRFSTSNLSMDGSMVDFGSCRSLPDWRMHFSLAGECFGAELTQLRRAFLSAAAYFAKYAPHSLQGLDVRQFFEQLRQVEQRSFTETCLHGLGFDPRDSSFRSTELATLLAAYYQLQQSIAVGFEGGNHCWISGSLRPNRGVRADLNAGTDIAGRIASILRQADGSTDHEGVSLRKARQFFGTRRRLQYTAMERNTAHAERLVGKRTAAVAETVGNFIDRQLAKCVAWHLLVPRRYDVLDVDCNVYSFICLCERKHDRRRAFWVEAPIQDGHLLILGQRVPFQDVSNPSFHRRRGTVAFEVPMEQFVGGTLSIGGCPLLLAPRFSHT